MNVLLSGTAFSFVVYASFWSKFSVVDGEPGGLVCVFGVVLWEKDKV